MWGDRPIGNAVGAVAWMDQLAYWTRMLEHGWIRRRRPATNTRGTTTATTAAATTMTTTAGSTAV